MVIKLADIFIPTQVHSTIEKTRGVKVIYAEGHINIVVALKRLIFRLYECDHFVTYCKITSSAYVNHLFELAVLLYMLFHYSHCVQK